MKLLISLTSRYARAARIAVPVLELQGQVDVQTVNHRGFDERLLKKNPLGKVPTLILQDEAVLFDSRVIVSHLYEQAGRAAELHRGPKKSRGATRQALATGVMDCTIAAAVEKRNHAPDCQNSAWIDRQEGKLCRVLGFLAETGLLRISARFRLPMISSWPARSDIWISFCPRSGKMRIPRSSNG